MRIYWFQVEDFMDNLGRALIGPTKFVLKGALALSVFALTAFMLMATQQILGTADPEVVFTALTTEEKLVVGIILFLDVCLVAATCGLFWVLYLRPRPSPSL